MSESKKYTLKEILIYIGMIIPVILGGKEIYGYFKSEIKAEGIVSSYQSPPFLLNEYKKSQVYSSALKSIAKSNKVFSQQDVDTLVKEKEAMYPAYSLDDTMALVISRDGDFRSYWVFKIKNVSDKPIEEMILQTETNGFCKVEFPSEKSVYHSFTKKNRTR